MPEFRETTRAIMKMVEEASGFPVVVQREPRLTTAAAVRMARGSLPGHVVLYRPQFGTEPDYLICHQCGFILRKFLVPPADMVDMAPGPGGLAAVGDLVSEAGARLSPAQADRFNETLLSGLLTQLLSTPVGMRVAAWLDQDYPELHELQMDYAQREITEARSVLRRKIREDTPPAVYAASVAMNAANAAYWADLLGRPSLATGWPDIHRLKAAGLLEIWREVPQEPVHDRYLIDRWGGGVGPARLVPVGALRPAPGQRAKRRVMRTRRFELTVDETTKKLLPESRDPAGSDAWLSQMSDYVRWVTS